MKHILLALSTFLLFTPSSFSQSRGKKEAQSFEKNIRTLFLKHDWAGIERIAAECREGKVEFVDGEPKLESLYAATNPNSFMSHSTPEEKWEQWYWNLEDWEKAIPDSVTLPGVKISYWTSFAWHARGNGYANTVTREGFELFRERLKAAEGILLRKTRLYGDKPFPCPGLYSVSVSIALGLGWDNEMVEARLIRPVVAIYPRYIPIYRRCMVLHDRKWGGKPGDKVRFIAKLMPMIGGDTGKEIYARVMTDSMCDSYHDWKPELVDEVALKDGMIEAVEKNQRSQHMIGRFVSFAQKFGAQEEILRRATEAAPKFMERFHNNDAYGAAWKLHLANPEGSSLRRIALYRPENFLSRDLIFHLSADAGGDLLSVPSRNRGENSLSLSTGKTKGVYRKSGHYTIGAALDPSGKFHFVATNPMNGTGKAVFSVFPTGREQEGSAIRSVETQCDRIDGIVFSPDSKQVYFAARSGVRGNENVAIYRWDFFKEGSGLEKIHSDEPIKRCVELHIDAGRNALYCGGRRLLRFDLNESGKQPETVCPDPSVAENHVDGFAIIEGTDLCALSTVVPKPWKPELLLINLKTGELVDRYLTKDVLNFEPKLIAIKSSDGKRDIIVTSGSTGCLTTWLISEKDGKPAITLETSLPCRREYTLALTNVRTPAGKNLIYQGTEYGMVLAFEVK